MTNAQATNPNRSPDGEVDLVGRAVIMSRWRAPAFPDRCMACGAELPETSAACENHAPLCDARMICFTPLRWIPGFRPRWLDVRVCTECRKSIERNQRWRFLACTVGVVLTVCAALILTFGYRDWLAGHSRGALGKLLVKLLVMVPVIIAAMIEIRLRPPFRFKVGWITTTFYFPSAALAHEFFRVNGMRGQPGSGMEETPDRSNDQTAPGSKYSE